MNTHVTMKHCTAHNIAELRENIVQVLIKHKGQLHSAYNQGVVDALLSTLEEIDEMEKRHQKQDQLAAGEVVDRLHKENSVSIFDIFGPNSNPPVV